MSFDRTPIDVERLTLYLQGHSEIEVKPDDPSYLEVTKLKFENEALEYDLNKEKQARLTLERELYHYLPAVEHERLFHSGHVDLNDIESHYTKLEKQIHFLETSNTTLKTALNGTRGQIGKIFHDFSKKSDEVKELTTTLELMRRCEKAAVVVKSNDDQQIIQSLKMEIEKLKAQKEDIVNHSKNSERMFNARILELTADMEKLHVRDLKQESLDEAYDKIHSLDYELTETQKELAKKEVQQQLLEQRLLHVTELKDKSEKHVEYNQLMMGQLVENRHIYSAERRDYELQIANLQDEVKGLEEMATTLRVKFEEVTEKLDKQTITFANEKAKFCHDLERVEEQWRAQVNKLNGKAEALIRGKREDKEYWGGLMADDEEVKTALRSEIETLKEEVEELKAAEKKTMDDWDNECAGLEDEIYSLIAQRKESDKQIKKLSRKYSWIAKCIKDLSYRRREEMLVIKADNDRLTNRCELLRKEKVEWLSDLKREVNEWKNETAERMDLEKRVEELEEENEDLEEKVENVTEKWRSECEVYEATMSMIHEDRMREMEEFRERLRLKNVESEAMKESLSRLENEKQALETKLETQKTDSLETIEQTARAGQLSLLNYKELFARNLRTKEIEAKSIQHHLKKRIAELEKIVSADKMKLVEANQSISNWQQKVQDIADSRATLVEEVYELKGKNDELRENMGVEVLDKSSEDDSSDDSDGSDSDDSCSSDEACDCPLCELNADREDIFEDMPKLKDEREEKTEQAKSDSDKDPEEWEVVEEKEDAW